MPMLSPRDKAELLEDLQRPGLAMHDPVLARLLQEAANRDKRLAMNAAVELLAHACTHLDGLTPEDLGYCIRIQRERLYPRRGEPEPRIKLARN